MTRKLGDREVTEIGFGCMGLSWAYTSADEHSVDQEAILHHALDTGIQLLDTSDFYGPFTNEELIGKVLRTRRDDAVISTKGGLVPSDTAFSAHDGRPEHIRNACDGSLRRLGIDHIDLYMLHRVDPDVPLEETWGAMAELVAAGKVRNIGLCEVSVEQCIAAAEIHPVAAVQSELSIWERGALDEVLPWCHSAGAAFLAFSPLGRGFLTGTFSSKTEFRNDDFRSSNPRFSKDAMSKNQRIVDVIADVARSHNATPAQISLAWLLAIDDSVIPIPGTTKRHRIDENFAALDIRLSTTDIEMLSSIPQAVQPRY
ncbi:aldo/keto reductase [Rhodococcus sp. ACS1]|uniref:aldo/keto reductase n=1 Tax=Rhodococcus sp. ACS1 TaxID=2028570 RepID=UPI000BB0E548|nr:aldo/keto reductase [Rhodococcus sp. ACS1]PBC35363.1 aldo/keto reductase [Rhodococcus sp. ACS1]